MSSPQEREAALFELALGKPVPERAAFLQAVCGADSALLRRLEVLLSAHDRPDELLRDDTSSPTVKATMKIDLADAPDEAVGQTLGRYKLLERVGEGGCGVVYVAEQTEPVRRRVALKVIKLGMDTQQVVARFEAERQALAMMDYPNIAKVLDAGSTEKGRPYFVMELVRGIRITDYCDQANLSTKERLELFIKVCQAIQHAHQKGIIHRDIKPSNILVTLHDGVPVPKVIDFGIAKATEGRLTDATVYTQLNQFMGTPAYMSPEQAEMSGLDIDTRSDIYSLGVLLYELLAGSTPFDAKELMASGIDQMRKTLREQEPVRPSTRLATLGADQLTTTARRRSADTSKLLHQLKGDLDWIVMKCLEKDRTRRYETANGLAADLHRHLTDEPVIARPPTAAYKFQKAWRRNKVIFTAGAAVALALVSGVAISAWQAARARRAERDQKQLRQQAEASQKVALAESARNGRAAAVMLEMAKTFNPTYWMERGPEGWDEPLDALTLRALDAIQGTPEMESEWCALMIRVHHDLGLLQEFSAGVPYRQGEYLMQRNWPAVRHKLVNHYQRLAEISQRALRLQEAKVDRLPLAHAESLASCGDALRHIGEWPAARARLREALALQRRHLRPTEPALGRTLCQLAIVEKLLGETNTANAAFDEGTSILAAHFADDTGARAYVGLARGVWNLGPPSAVEHVLHSKLDFHHKAQAMAAERSPKMDVLLSRPLTDLARVAKVREAALYEEAIRIESGILGSAHPVVEYLHRVAGRQPTNSVFQEPDQRPARKSSTNSTNRAGSILPAPVKRSEPRL